MNYIIDSYAWIEYLDGTKKGEKVKEVLTEQNLIHTSAITVAEVVSRAKRKDKDTVIAYQTITTNSNVININSEIPSSVLAEQGTIAIFFVKSSILKYKSESKP